MGLKSVVDDLWETAIAPSTKHAYDTGFNTFIRFLLMAGIINSVNLADMNVTENILIYFVAHCHNINLAYSTIKLYLCGIRFMCLKNDIPYPNNTNLCRMHAVLGGVKRTRRKVNRPRYPITFNILRDTCKYLRKNMNSFEDLMLETVCIVAFFAFLRCGEFTVNKQFDHNINLCFNDLIIANEHVLLNLKKSKTDPFREGVTLKLFKNGSEICPYVACCKYMAARQCQNPAPDDPLFVIASGQALTRTVFIARFRHVLECLGINSDCYNGHSFRIGAATTSSLVYLPDHLIKVLGRWSSDAYCRYIRTPNSSIREAQIALTSTG
ncbi:uncharacterized protein LOC110452048 [Mizuhopecten yessoensis]|uniref:uncharacterized protein LOC110452048 n=1 Tax=Mizuhopecten yessoensis TaxID=6573 RepID=UPI000B45EB2E|nr:uncharacterized protein LOC110452048 [Mizuhopecten yessoensis]